MQAKKEGMDIKSGTAGAGTAGKQNFSGAAAVFAEGGASLFEG
jgi:hypothetical protein